MSWAYQPILPAAQLLTQTPPTVALNSPADASSTSDTTPTLDFTGTDAQSDDIRYNVQIATSAFTQVSIANLTSGNDTDGNDSATTASVSPSANKLQLLKIVLRNGSSIQPSVLSVVGCGLTWEKVDNVDFDTSATSMRSIELWRAMGSSPSSGTIVITTNENETDIIWSLNEATNADTSGSNGSGAIVQSVTSADQSGADGYLSVTLAAFSNSNNATFGAFGYDIGTTGSSTPGSGFTELSDTGSGGGDLNGTAIWRNDNDTTVDITASANTFLGGIAIEIKAATQILLDKVSGTDSGFANPDVGGDTDPFTSGENIQFTVQAGDALAVGTYYWRVRGIDPTGSNSYGAWSTARSFTITAGGGTSVKDLICGFIPFAR